jgi:hypothetical protein
MKKSVFNPLMQRHLNTGLYNDAAAVFTGV